MHILPQGQHTEEEINCSTTVIYDKLQGRLDILTYLKVDLLALF